MAPFGPLAKYWGDPQDGRPWCKVKGWYQWATYRIGKHPLRILWWRDWWRHVTRMSQYNAVV